MKKLFHDKSKELENDIEGYLVCQEKAVHAFFEGLEEFLNGNPDIEPKMKLLFEIEQEADEYLKKIKYYLFKYNLMPDLSADILELMDALDDIADISKHLLTDLGIERPKIFPEIIENTMEMTKLSIKTVEELIEGVRVFFSQVNNIDKYIDSVYFYEAEIDKAEEALKRIIFSQENEIALCEKIHLRYFVNGIASISDTAEVIAMKLSVFKFKRGI